ncbi:MAG: hypothetical protein R3A51_07350 [Nannocystaceae bacterium]|nr:hypothetical protein [Myxococcales bacterium]
MRLIKASPVIKLFAPPVIRIGAPFELRIVLDCPRALEVNGVTVELEGSESWRNDQGGHQVNRFCAARVELCKKTTLAAGVREYPLTFTIPARYPGSYSGQALRIDWSVRVHVDIPWWPDAVQLFLVRVVHPGAPVADEPRTLVYVSNLDGPSGTRPYFEVTLASNVITPGGFIEGAIAPSNVRSNTYRGFEFTLVGVERQRSGYGASQQHRRAHWRIPVDAPGEGESTRFRLSVPSGLVPGFRTPTAELTWHLEVEADVVWSVDPRTFIALVVRPGQAEAPTGERTVAAVGSARVRAIWAEASRRTDLALANGALEAERGAVRLSLRREHQGRRGVRVIGELHYPGLGLNLGLSWASGALSARDAGQREHLRRRLGERFTKHPPRSVSDGEMTFLFEETGHRLEPLIVLARAFAALAEAVRDAFEALPSPAFVAAALDEWQRAAERLGGRLSPAVAKITGTHGERGFSLDVAFKPGGEPDAFELAIAPVEAVPERHHITWSSGQAMPADRSLRALLRSCDAAARLTVDAQRMALTLPFATGIEEAALHLERLIATAARILDYGGPYR